MSNVIQIKRASGKPSGNKLVQGELAIDLGKNELYVGTDNGDKIINVGGAQFLRNTSATRYSIGSSKLPIYFNNGIPVQCGTSLDVNITGNAATATTATYLPAQTSGAGTYDIERYIFMSWTSLSTQQITYHSTLTYNTQTQTLTAPKFKGNLVGNATTATTANSVAWSKITGKPEKFEPSAHTHNYIPLGGTTEALTIKKTCPSYSTSTAAYDPSNVAYTGPNLTLQNGSASEGCRLNFSDANNYWWGQSLTLVGSSSGISLQAPYFKGQYFICKNYGTSLPTTDYTSTWGDKVSQLYGLLFFKVVS